MTRKVCFISEEGQVATCIRDDESCAVCDSKADYGKGFETFLEPGPAEGSREPPRPPRNVVMIGDYRAQCCGTCANRKKEAYPEQYGDRVYCLLSWTFKDRYGICSGEFKPEV